MSNYTQMWLDLDLDPKAHDALPSILGSAAYQEVFLSQDYCPEGMKRFNFVLSEKHVSAKLDEVIESGK